MKKSFIILLLISFTFAGIAQDFYKIPSTQIRFFAKPILMNNLKFKHHGEKILKSYPFISFEAGIGIKQRIWENLSVIVDFGYGLVPYQFQFSFYADIEHVIGNFHEHKTTESYYGNFIIPISLQYETLKNKKLNFFAELGIKINILEAYPWVWENGMGYYLGDLIPPDDLGNHVLQIFDMYTEAFEQRAFVSYFAKIGLVLKTKKYHTFNLSLIGNYCPKKPYTGYYKFSNVPFDSYGDVSFGLSYIGLEFVFGLSVRKVDFLSRK
jgi:hypothetical protein